jgi:hypothetical protein
VAVSGMTADGTVTASVNAGGATDAAGNANAASGVSSVDYEAPSQAPLAVTSITPISHASCSCSFAVTVAGGGFAPGLSLTFSVGSGPTPTASGIVVAADGASFTATVTLKSGGPPRPRVWDVTVTNPDGASVTLTGGFTVTP